MSPVKPSSQLLIEKSHHKSSMSRYSKLQKCDEDKDGLLDADESEKSSVAEIGQIGEANRETETG